MPRADRGLLTMSFERLQWLFPIAVTLHNSEEAIFFPAWWARLAREIPAHPNPALFRFALALLTAAAFLVTFFNRQKGRESLWAYLTFGYIVAMLINVFIPHIPASVMFRSYTPGVVTAVLINLPVMTWLAFRALRDRWVSGRKALRFAIAVPVAMAGIIPVLLLIG
ncbi:MAG: HXXEE domain-containing protein [Terriglobales bacterium]